MINLQDLLATNMRRFGTKNLNEKFDPRLTKVFDPAELSGLEKFLLSQVAQPIGTVVTYPGITHYFVCTRIDTSKSDVIAAFDTQFDCQAYYVGTRFYETAAAAVSFPDLIQRFIDIDYNSKPRSGELNLMIAKSSSVPDLSPTPRVSNASAKRVADVAPEIAYNFRVTGAGGAAWAAKQTAGPAAAAWAKTMTDLKHPELSRELNMANTVVAAIKAGGGAAAAYYNALPTQAPATVQKTAVPVKKP